jgi:hypothetical protein
MFFYIQLFVILFFLDILIQMTIKENSQYFVLHVFFNLWIVVMTFPDTTYTLTSPYTFLNNLNGDNVGFQTTMSISVFHLYHTISSWKKLTSDDVIHHVVSCFLVPSIVYVVLYKYERLLSASNFFMCGLPGAVQYLLMILNRYDLISKFTEKQYSRYLNLCLRLPFQIFTSIIYLNIITRYENNYVICLAVICSLAHNFNAVYYTDQIIRSFYITKLQS